MHEHVTESGERVEHGHPFTGVHWHRITKHDPEGLWVQGGLGGETSVHYSPRADGSPDPRDMCMTEHVALAASERLRDKAEADLREAVGLLAAASDYLHDDPDDAAHHQWLNKEYRAFLAKHADKVTR